MRKLAVVSLSFCAAVAVCQYLVPETLWLWIALAVGIIGGCGLLLRGDLRRYCCAIAFAFALGCLYNSVFMLRVHRALDEHLTEEGYVEAEVLDFAEPTARRWRIPVEVQGGRTIRGMLYGGQEVCGYHPGDRLTGMMMVTDASVINDTPLTTFTAKGCFVLLFPAEEVSVSPGMSAWRYAPQYMSHCLLRETDTLFGDETAPLVRALLLGDTSLLREGLRSDLSEAGIYHITAVSGMHCGFLLAMVALFISRRRRQTLAVVSIPLLWIYVLLTGGPASVVRSAVMLSFVLLGNALQRENDYPTALSFALLVLLLANPCAVTGAGLQLSFGAVTGLLLLTPHISAALPGKGMALTRWINVSLSASLGVMAMTAPLSALYFGVIPLLGPLANLLVIPIASFTFVVCLLAVLLGLAYAPLGGVLAAVGGAGARLILRIAHVLSGVPNHAAYFVNPYLRYWLLFALVLLAYCVFTPPERRKYALAAALSVATLAATMYLPIVQRKGRLHMVALDVGQGASAILASDGAAAMVDCGSSNSYIDAGGCAADTLNTYGYYKLDYLILTHYHADHTNGLPVLMARVPVDTIVVPYPGEDDAFHASLLLLSAQYGADICYVDEDTCLRLGDDAVLQLFAPLGDGESNERGLSILCTVGDYDALITGDMNRSAEKLLVEGKTLSDLEVLFVGHHGAANSTGAELLSLMPEVGIISVGENSYGHPDGETMQRMVRRGMTIYRTDLQGNISLVVQSSTGDMSWKANSPVTKN